MSDLTTNKPAIWYWIVAVILFLWGAAGLWVFYDFISASPEQIAKYIADGAFSQDYADALAKTPTWVTIVFALAVVTGFLGSLCLLLRRYWAVPLYLVSLIFVLVLKLNTFVIAKVHTLMNGTQIGMEVFVLVLALVGYLVAKLAKSKSWLA